MRKTFWIAHTLCLCPLVSSAQTGSYRIQNFDFAYLMNEHRIGAPEIPAWAGDFFAYANDGTAVLLNEEGYPDRKGRSPMQAYDQISGLRAPRSAHEWEKKNHTCRELKGEEKKSCEGWWGHCNGWAAAAVKHYEPRSTMNVKGTRLSIAEQKGILAELWLSTDSLMAGETNKSRKTGAWVGLDSPDSQSFWDIQPRSFFLILTNYVGIFKQGLVIDRFTGDEVWNHPLAGYRILPISPQDVNAVTHNGKTLWAVSMTVKLYWANDMGLPAGHISQVFDVQSHTTDSSKLESLPRGREGVDFEGRILSFTLFLDAPVEWGANGKILKAGKLVGPGIWEHQKNVNLYRGRWEDLNHTHPDFVWTPTNPFHDLYGGYGNPYVIPSVAMSLFTEQGLGPRETWSESSFTLRRDALEKLLKTRSLSESLTTKGIRLHLARFSIRADVELIRMDGNTVHLKIFSPSDTRRIEGALRDLRLL